MTTRAKNWLKFGGLVGLAFTLGLLFSGLLDLPRRSAAQEGALRAAPAASLVERVQPPALPAAAAPLADLSDAFAAATTCGMYVIRLAAFATFRSRGRVDWVNSVNTLSEMYSP